MTEPDGSSPPNFALGCLRRFGVYLGMWLVLIGFSETNLVVGLGAAALSTWVSVLLLPVSNRRLSFRGFARLSVRLLWQSLVAGVDVARRALDPRLPLHPGYITYATAIAPGPQRNAFRALMSLQPGALPVSTDDSGALLVHCLDTRQPYAAQMAREERFFADLTRGDDRP